MTGDKARRPRNVAKLLARLNPKSMPLKPGGGFGGIPEETAIDIAGALGAAAWGSKPGAKRLAVMVLCMRWWPAVFDGPDQVIGYRDEVRTTNVTRITGQRAAMATPDPYNPLRLRHRALRETSRIQTRERVAITATGETPSFRAVVSLLSNAIERSILRDQYRAQLRIGDELWAWLKKDPRVSVTARGPLHGPPLPDAMTARVLADGFMGAWSRLVIHEYRNPHHCQTCTTWGRAGEVPAFEGDGTDAKLVWITCPTCLGAGVTDWSSKRRAAALSIGEHPFRDFLRAHHNGALTLLRELEWRGALLLVARLGRK